MKALIPFFSAAEIAPVERATQIHYGYLVADSKLASIFTALKGSIVRLDFGEPEPAEDVGKLPILIVKPEIVDREPNPGRWGDVVRVRDILRIEWKGQQMIPKLPADEPGIGTLINYIVGVGLKPGARQLKYTPTGKTQERPFSRRIETPTVSCEPIILPDTGRVILEYIIDFDFPITLINNGWQAEAALSDP